ncbi:MAG: mechanosensitive ion channel family protein [Actinobacteria bacterium]|nr:mechanosensitive ion channel family protein [Actinomycetota bacterium]
MSPTGHLLAQRENETEQARPFADILREQFGDTVYVEIIELVIEPVLQIALILLLAGVLLRLGRRFLARSVAEMKDPGTHSRLGSIRRRMRLGEQVDGPQTLNPRRIQRAEALGALGRSVLTAVVWTVALFMILGVFGFELGPLIAGAGIVGVALGFGSQSLVKDFLSGIFMLIEDQYGLGDIVDVGEATGTVEAVGLRTTRIRDVEGTLWHVPNGEIRRVGNMSQDWARTLLDIGVAYGTDVDEATQVILGTATDMAAEEDWAPLFLDEPVVWGVQNLGPDAVDIRLVIKTRPGDQWVVGRELRARLKKAFDAHGIEIPFPQRTIWVRSHDDTGGARSLPAPAKKPTRARKSTTEKKSS